MLKGKTIVLGVTGSIAAYKAVDLASKLTQAGALVEVVMTGSATEFVTPLSFASLTQRPVITKMFQSTEKYSIAHVALAEAADMVVICPATANTIAKLANGLADDMLSCTVLATEAPVIVAPAMNVNMYENTITQENIKKLIQRGFVMVGPTSGRLASGRLGSGRLVEISEVIAAIKQVFARHGKLSGRRIVVTAGGTREPIDPVRYVGNHSSGKMGYAIAEAARDMGAQVTLISAPSALLSPAGVEVIQVQTAKQMYEAVVNAVKGAEVLIMAAAVADYSPVNVAENKIKKDSDKLTLHLVRTVDILGAVAAQGLIKVGFAAESENVEENARKKLREKQVDIIVANDITANDSGFNVDTNEVLLIDRDGRTAKLPLMQKSELAVRILDKVAELLNNR